MSDDLDTVEINPGSGGARVAVDSLLDETNVPVVAQTVKILMGGAGVNEGFASSDNPLPVSGPLTDAQLRASAVSVSGPLTDAQLRASAVPVSGPLTDAQLRASAVPMIMSAASEPMRDAFGRFRVSNPITLLDATHQYDTSPMHWGTLSSGSGTITHRPNYSAVELSCSTSNGDYIKYQSRKYVRYQPGKSQQILMSFVLGTTKTNVRRRVGYFDDSDGIFLEQNSTVDVAIVKRTSTSGTPDDTRILQEDWNLDPMDGTGPSGQTLDLARSNLLVIDLQWLSVGRVRVGFDIDGYIYYVHQFVHANVAYLPYMKTANLPVRYEQANIGAVSGSTTMLAICSAVTSEGGKQPLGVVRSANSGTTGESVTSAEVVLAVRPKLTFNSLVNRGHLTPHSIDILASGDILWELRLLISLTSPSWVSAGTNSIAEYDISATGFSGGELVASGYKGTGSGTTTTNLELDGILQALSPDGTTSDILGLVVTSLSGSVNVWAAMQWLEEY